MNLPYPSTIPSGTEPGGICTSTWRARAYEREKGEGRSRVTVLVRAAVALHLHELLRGQRRGRRGRGGAHPPPRQCRTPPRQRRRHLRSPLRAHCVAECGVARAVPSLQAQAPCTSTTTSPLTSVQGLGPGVVRLRRGCGCLLRWDAQLKLLTALLMEGNGVERTNGTGARLCLRGVIHPHRRRRSAHLSVESCRFWHGN